MSTDTPESADTLTPTEACTLLSNERRQLVIELLADAPDRELRLRELAKRVAGIENDCQPAAVAADDYKTVYVGLYQCHLDRLCDAGVVALRDRHNRVQAGPAFDSARRALAAVDDALGDEAVVLADGGEEQTGDDALVWEFECSCGESLDLPADDTDFRPTGIGRPDCPECGEMMRHVGPVIDECDKCHTPLLYRGNQVNAFGLESVCDGCYDRISEVAG